MVDRITGWLAIAALFAIVIALAMFPPAAVVVGVAFVWWMVRKENEFSRERVEQFEREREQFGFKRHYDHDD